MGLVSVHLIIKPDTGLLLCVLSHILTREHQASLIPKEPLLCSLYSAYHTESSINDLVHGMDD